MMDFGFINRNDRSYKRARGLVAKMTKASLEPEPRRHPENTPWLLAVEDIANEATSTVHKTPHFMVYVMYHLGRAIAIACQDIAEYRETDLPTEVQRVLEKAR